MKPVKRGIVVFGAAILVVGAVTLVSASVGKWDIKKIKGSTLYFKNGKSLDTKLHDVKYVGKLNLKEQSPLYIVSGVTCQDCDEYRAVFLYSPAESKQQLTPEYAPYDFPGREFSEADSALVYESRMFYGNVLPDVPSGIIWYQNMLTEDGIMEKSVYLMRIEEGKVSEKMLLENLPSIETTLKLVAQNKCKEVQGVDTVTEP